MLWTSSKRAIAGAGLGVMFALAASLEAAPLSSSFSSGYPGGSQADAWTSRVFADDDALAEIRARAVSLLNQGDWREARSTLQQGLMLDIRAVELLQLMAQAEMAAGRSTHAGAYLAHALRLADANARAGLYTRLVAVLSQLNRHAEAHALAETADRSALPTGLRAMIKARYLASRGRYPEALEALAVAPDELSVAQIRAQVYLLSGEAGTALGVLQAAGLEGDPLSTLASLLMTAPVDLAGQGPDLRLKGDEPPVLGALVAMARGDSATVRRHLGNAGLPLAEMVRHDAFLTQLEEPAPARELALAHFCLDQGYLDQALQLSRHLQDEHPGHVLPVLVSAEVRRQQGDLEGATERYSHALEMIPASVGLRFQRAQLLASSGDVSSALVEYRDMLETQPDFVAGQLAYAELLGLHRGWEAAREALSWALNFKPEAAPLLQAYALAEVESRKGRLSAESLRALEGQPVEAAELAWLRARAALLRGEVALGKGHLVDAVEASPQAPWLEELATLQRQSGRLREAEQLACQAALLSLKSTDWTGPAPGACDG